MAQFFYLKACGSPARPQQPHTIEVHVWASDVDDLQEQTQQTNR
jgi:hypothetical protein